MDNEKVLEISWGTILRVSLAIFCFYLVFLVRNILVLSVFGFVISILFEVPTRILERKIPRALAVVFLYVLAFSLICLLVYFPASRFISEIGQFVGVFPTYFEKAIPSLRALGIEALKDIESFVDALEKIIEMATANIFNVLFSIFGGISRTIFVISIAIFLSLQGNIEKNLILLFPKKDEEFVLSLWQRCQKKVGLWFLTSLIGCFFVGLLSFFTFYLLKTKYPFLLSLIAGALNFVPILGPIFAGFLIFVILALDSLTKALFALACFTIIQQLENNIFIPLVAKKFVGLSPILILISLTIGGKLFGILGAILMIPLVGIIVEFSKGLLERKREAEL